jgi:hypothetical protein
MEGIEFLKDLLNLIGLAFKYGLYLVPFLIVGALILMGLGEICEYIDERAKKQAKQDMQKFYQRENQGKIKQ